MKNSPGAERKAQIREFQTISDRKLGFDDDLRYRTEDTYDAYGKKIGVELLIAHPGYRVEYILTSMRNEGKTLALFQKGFLEAFCRVVLETAGVVSFNAYIADIGDSDFREAVMMTMRCFNKSYRKRIKIEVLETPFGEIDGKFIANIIWLKKQGFIVDIDDYNLLGITDDMSQELLDTIGEYVDGIKIDWKTTQMLLQDPALRTTLRGLRKMSGKRITLEGVQGEGQIGEFIDIGADYFQISGYGNL